MNNLSVALLRLNSCSRSNSPMLSATGPVFLFRFMGIGYFSSIVMSHSTISATESAFVRSLSSPIVIESSYSAIYTSQISSFASISSFTACIFRNCTTTTNGGAVYCVSAASIAFTLCLFENCVVTGHGGAIYASSTPMSFTSCCFRLCYINQKVNEQWGNSIYFVSSTFSMNQTQTVQCGPSSSADSSYFVQSSMTTVYYTNATGNVGFGGPADGLIYSPTSGSTHCYCLICNTASVCDGFEWRYCSSLSISHINFFNVSASLGLLYSAGSLATVVNSTLVKNGNSAITYCEGGGSIVLVRCVSDYSSSLVTVTSNPVTDSADIINSKMCYFDAWISTSEFSQYSFVMPCLTSLLLETSILFSTIE